MKRNERIKWIEGVHFKRIDPHRNGGMKYELLVDMVHRGPGGMLQTLKAGTQSNGADCVEDLCPEAFFSHDGFCVHPYWDDGTPISNWGASREYRHILRRNGFGGRSIIRHYGTFLFGGQRIKKECGWFFTYKAQRD